MEPTAPISLAKALSSFDALWSPRIVTTVNDYDVRVAKVEGDHLWHVHENTDEFFLVFEGELHIGLREPEGNARSSCLRARSSPSHEGRAQAVRPVPRRHPRHRTERYEYRRRPA